MSFLRAACAALVGPTDIRKRYRALTFVPVLLLASVFLSCGSSSSSTAPNHTAYVSLPSEGSVLVLQLNGSNGIITLGGKTPSSGTTSPTGLALLPSKKFLYTANSRENTISTFNVANDGSLTLTAVATPAGGSSPNAAVIDPTGGYLLVTNNLSNNISVFSINGTTGALTMVGSPVPANPNPTQIRFTHSGQFVYVTNPGTGTVTGFSFDATSGLLTPTTTVVSGSGAAALAVDANDQYLYVANASATNPPPYSATVGNISAFSIDSSGGLTPILGSPFTSTNGTNGPTAITVDPSGRFVYAVTAGSSFSIWCFAITPTNGELVAVTGSPFSLAGGGLFALFASSGNFFYVGSGSPVGIEGYTYNTSTGVPILITGSPFSTGTPPGNMVVSD